MPINNYYMQKKPQHTSASSIKHQDLLGYIISSEINQSITIEAFKCVLYVIPMDMFSIFLISAKSNDITNIFVKSILVQKIAVTSIYYIFTSPEHFEIKNNELRPLLPLKIDSYQLFL